MKEIKDKSMKEIKAAQNIVATMHEAVGKAHDDMMALYRESGDNAHLFAAWAIGNIGGLARWVPLSEVHK